MRSSSRPRLMTMTASPRTRAERIEVRLSREKILEAAERHYSVEESDPTMAHLARMADVGVATLYRRYPRVDDVVRDLYTHLMREFAPLSARIAAQATGWGGIVVLVEGIVDTLQAHPAIPRLNRRMVALDSGHRFADEWQQSLDALVLTAQKEGALRADVNSNDITFAAFRLGSYLNLPPAEKRRVLGRQTTIVLDGLRAYGSPTAMPGMPFSHEDVHQIFRHEVDNPRHLDDDDLPAPAE